MLFFNNIDEFLLFEHVFNYQSYLRLINIYFVLKQMVLNSDRMVR